MLRYLSLIFTLFTLFASAQSEKGKMMDTFKDTVDGKFDMSDWLTNYHGFVPIVIPVTEPAVDYGVAVGLLFLHRSKKYPYQPPGTSLVLGAYMFNKSWVGLLAHKNYFFNDKLRYVGALGYGDINLDFYRNTFLGEIKTNVSFKAPFFFQRLTYKIPSTKLFVGATYINSNVNAKLNSNLVDSIFGGWESDYRMAAIKGTLFWDGRDNTFTPNNGIYLFGEYGFYEEWLGSDFVFNDFNLSAHLYTDVINKWVLALRLESRNIIGDAPFFALPFITMRGIPAMRYQGQSVINIETEERWKFSKRWSAVGFFGGGLTRDKDESFDGNNSYWAGGLGTRYLIASWYDFNAGFDFAYGADGFAFYVTVGSAWVR